MWHRALATVLIAVLWLGSGTTETELVVTQEGASLYHRPGCAVVSDGKGVVVMERDQAESRGLKPHRDCDPSVVPPPPKAVPPPKPVLVFIDEAGTFYHREKCQKLGKSPRRVSVHEAAKKHWPCRTCKPPIRPRK